jgi:hypothetical protein
MQSVLQIIKVNEARSGNSKVSGKPYTMQDCECLLLDAATGAVDQVGVLMLPRDLTGKVVPGVYIGSFALKADMQTRKIGAVLTGLQPYTVKGNGATAAAVAPSKVPA